MLTENDLKTFPA